ncbi:unnamed protein product [Vitrella brassicaformis CCMP3155]|uniref:Uncharacterized protein n=2 Tax=Vitrella brassicaformis TaxID=1169539 RepID=A0A0G4EVE8_VITBC|nr:unnamed protein product [Vitrella brassicaformis CCMP3155]|eukprot:CEM02045.1 unnamed protein product [Vitrella brassicaformis CCMP3155]
MQRVTSSWSHASSSRPPSVISEANPLPSSPRRYALRASAKLSFPPLSLRSDATRALQGVTVGQKEAEREVYHFKPFAPHALPSPPHLPPIEQPSRPSSSESLHRLGNKHARRRLVIRETLERTLRLRHTRAVPPLPPLPVKGTRLGTAEGRGLTSLTTDVPSQTVDSHSPFPSPPPSRLRPSPRVLTDRSAYRDDRSQVLTETRLVQLRTERRQRTAVPKPISESKQARSRVPSPAQEKMDEGRERLRTARRTLQTPLLDTSLYHAVKDAVASLHDLVQGQTVATFAHNPKFLEAFLRQLSGFVQLLTSKDGGPRTHRKPELVPPPEPRHTIFGSLMEPAAQAGRRKQEEATMTSLIRPEVVRKSLHPEHYFEYNGQRYDVDEEVLHAAQRVRHDFGRVLRQIPGWLAEMYSIPTTPPRAVWRRFLETLVSHTGVFMRSYSRFDKVYTEERRRILDCALEPVRLLIASALEMTAQAQSTVADVDLFRPLQEASFLHRLAQVRRIGKFGSGHQPQFDPRLLSTARRLDPHGEGKDNTIETFPALKPLSFILLSDLHTFIDVLIDYHNNPASLRPQLDENQNIQVALVHLEETWGVAECAFDETSLQFVNILIHYFETTMPPSLRILVERDDPHDQVLYSLLPMLILLQDLNQEESLYRQLFLPETEYFSSLLGKIRSDTLNFPQERWERLQNYMIKEVSMRVEEESSEGSSEADASTVARSKKSEAPSVVAAKKVGDIFTASPKAAKAKSARSRARRASVIGMSPTAATPSRAGQASFKLERQATQTEQQVFVMVQRDLQRAIAPLQQENTAVRHLWENLFDLSREELACRHHGISRLEGTNIWSFPLEEPRKAILPMPIDIQKPDSSRRRGARVGSIVSQQLHMQAAAPPQTSYEWTQFVLRKLPLAAHRTKSRLAAILKRCAYIKPTQKEARLSATGGTPGATTPRGTIVMGKAKPPLKALLSLSFGGILGKRGGGATRKNTVVHAHKAKVKALSSPSAKQQERVGSQKSTPDSSHSPTPRAVTPRQKKPKGGGVTFGSPPKETDSAAGNGEVDTQKEKTRALSVERPTVRRATTIGTRKPAV